MSLVSCLVVVLITVVLTACTVDPAISTAPSGPDFSTDTANGWTVTRIDAVARDAYKLRPDLGDAREVELTAIDNDLAAETSTILANRVPTLLQAVEGLWLIEPGAPNCALQVEPFIAAEIESVAELKEQWEAQLSPGTVAMVTPVIARMIDVLRACGGGSSGFERGALAHSWVVAARYLDELNIEY